MEVKYQYTLVWDIIDKLLQRGAVLYGPCVSNIFHSTDEDPYLKDNLIRAHFYSETVRDIEVIDKTLSKLGYKIILKSSKKPYKQGNWHYTTYCFSPLIQLPFTPPLVRVSIRPKLSYSLRVSDSLCLVYDDTRDCYCFFYAGVYFWRDKKWWHLHKRNLLGSIHLRSFRNKSWLTSGSMKLTSTGVLLENE